MEEDALIKGLKSGADCGFTQKNLPLLVERYPELAYELFIALNEASDILQ